MKQIVALSVGTVAHIWAFCNCNSLGVFVANNYLLLVLFLIQLI